MDLSPADQLFRWGFRGSRRVALFQAAYVGPDHTRPADLEVDGVLGPETTAAIRQSQAAGGRASAHFTWTELECRCNGRYAGCLGIRIVGQLLVGAEILRARHYPHGLTVRSAYRCPQHNAAVGGAEHGEHPEGRALDIDPAVFTADVRRLGVFTGIGYSPSTGEVVHVDVRPHPVAPFPDGP